MNVMNIKQEGAAMKQVETAIRIEEEKPALYTSILGEKNRPVRQVSVSRISTSLVTLAPAGSELDAKQQVMAEQFRMLRTRVKALSKGFKLRTILVTSALPGEGKTTVAANLAGSLSRVEGLRVLLIDFDLRHPSLHTIFGVDTDMRSPSAMNGEMPWQEAIYQVNRRLDVLFGFRQLEEPDRLLQSSRLEKLVEEAKAAYDVVILDSAPLLAVADTQSLVPLVDCALFVLNADNTEISAAREALTMLHDKVAGCVVNRVSNLKSEGYYLNSGYGYGYGSKRTEN
jgi:protein-tyrosine kinase